MVVRTAGIATLTVQFGLWAYLLILVRRTGFLAHPTSIDLGIMYGFLLLSILCVVAPLFLVRFEPKQARFLRWQAAGAGTVGLAFLALAIKGYVGEYWY